MLDYLKSPRAPSPHVCGEGKIERSYLEANWPSPSNVFALTTTRSGGISQPPYDGNNLALHVGDNRDDVLQNRDMMMKALNLTSSPHWLEQTHSTCCVVVEDDDNRLADAAITRQPNTVLAIMTADCLPIVISNTNGTEIAAIHAGWRGLANGIIEETLIKMHSPSHDLMAWIGPAVCQQCYETGEEVHKAFTSQFPFTSAAFKNQDKSLYANLPQLAELILNHHGIQSVYQSNQCTYEAKNENNNKNKYYSYRLEKQTGRIVTLIWFN